MTRNGFIAMLAGALALSAGGATAYAQQTSEARIQELIRAAAERFGIGQQTPISQPTPAESGAVVALTLDDAVKLALDRNLDIAVQRLNPEINDIAIVSARAVYNPTLTSSIGPQSVTQLPTSQL